MGQIVGGAAKPKRCNLNKLSQLGTPAAGEYILVSSDNSMNAAGQGNFDAYIVGDGSKPAQFLEIKKIDENEWFKKLLGEPAYTLELANYQELSGLILEGGNFQSNGAYGNHKHIIIPVVSGDVYEVVNNSTTFSYAFLTSYQMTSGTQAPFVENTTLINKYSLDKGTFIIPDGCKYLYVYAKNGSGTSYLPTSFARLSTIGELEQAIGVYYVDENVPTTSSVFTLKSFKVAKAPIRFVVSVLECSAQFDDADNFLGYLVGSTYTTISFDSSLKAYIEVTDDMLLSSTEFTLYVRKVTTSGKIKLRVDIDNSSVEIPPLKRELLDIKETQTDLQDSIEAVAIEVNDVKNYLPKADWEKQETSEGVFAPVPNQVQGYVGCRLYNGKVAAASNNNALVTNFIPIDNTLAYKIKTYVGSLFNGVAYYSEMNDNSYLGNDVFHSNSFETIEAELTIPSNATYMKFASADVSIAYQVFTKDLLGIKNAISADDLEPINDRLEANESEIDSAQEDILTLFGIVSDSDVPPENAIKYIPTIKLYLGSDILNINDVTYDSNYWSVVNGLPKYLGGGDQTKTFKFNGQTIADIKYLCDIVTLTSDGRYENLFFLKIGDLPSVDTYNGSRTTFGGFKSDGGQFEIIPFGTKAFDVTSIQLRPCVSNEQSAGYTETKTLPVDNIGCGNSAATLIDGKWNTAVGPTGNCMAKNVNGSRSIAIGFNALREWYSGLQNIAIGTFALSLLEEGNHNIAIGSDCLWQAKKAQDNIAIGKGALGKTGVYDELLNNVAVGHSSMSQEQSTTRDSVAVGYNSNTYGAAYSVFVGSSSSTTAANSSITNAIAIGYNSRATKSNQCVLGNASVSEFVLGNKKLIFNQDGTVSWEVVSE